MVGDFVRTLFMNKGQRKNYKYARMMGGYTPVFSQFGDNVYTSDVVQMCVDVIATECSKLQPRHLRVDAEGKQISPKSSLNSLFEYGPNELMTTRDFIEKIIWQLFANYNCFIYPTYELEGGKRQYTGLYPLNPKIVTFLQDEQDNLFIEMQFENGERTTLAYSDVIHLRKKYSCNDFMGGGIDGQPDHTALLKVLQINDAVLQGLEKGVKTSMSIRGVLKINTMLDDEAQKAERARFEALMASGTSGILPLDLKGDYTPLIVDPKLIDKDTLEFLEKKVLFHYGVSVPMLNGDYNDEQYQAFYEKTLEPIVIMLTQAFSKGLFTRRELEFGNKVIFGQKAMMYLSATAKMALIKTAGEQGLLTDNQKLAIFGYPPLLDGSGERRTMSLNYIDVSYATKYQMQKTGDKEGDKKDE